jgi:[ribosomal protein S18]-alanine N-acetyltransferase
MCPDIARPLKPLTISVCQKENLGRVHALLAAAPEAAAWSSASLAETFERYPSYFLVCWQGDELSGFVSGRKVADEGEILNLAVKPSSRCHGIGTALVKSLLELLAREAVVKVFLEVRESNSRAASFYKGLGFRQAGRREGYYREPVEAALILSLGIEPQAGTSRPSA